jgi:Skp family chaperone for outer membrane proteins
MRAFVVAAALSVMLAAAPGFAQAPAPAPAPAPASPAAAAPAPFPTGAKYAFINIQRIAAESAQGKSLSSRVQALNNQKVTQLNEKNKALQTAQQKLDSGGSVLSDAARAQLEKDIDRQQTDIQRFTDDAQKEVQDLQNELQAEFQQKLGPIIQQVAQEKKLEILFSALDAGIVWADAGLDLTPEVIRRFDAANPASTAAAPAAPAPAAPAVAAPPAPAGRQGAPAAPRPAAPAPPRSGGAPAPAPK